MKNLLDIIRDIFARPKADSAPKSALRCEFCGQTGHATADCPNAAKFHVFSVDHDRDDDDKS